jgi:ribosomal protein S18 acetylase RimI-like enzyme
MNIEFKCLLPGESSEYRKIRLESLKEFPDFFSADYEESVKLDKISIESDIENQTSDKFVCGAFLNNQLIGIGVLVKNAKDIGNIYQMYVKPEFQGHNIGLQLLETIIREAEIRFGKIELSLEVQSNNYKAIKLYSKAGFQPVSERKEDHCIVMAYKYE